MQMMGPTNRPFVLHAAKPSSPSMGGGFTNAVHTRTSITRLFSRALAGLKAGGTLKRICLWLPSNWTTRILEQ